MVSEKTMEYLPYAAMFVMLLFVQAGALLLTPAMNDARYTAFDDPSAIENIVFFFAILIGFTALMLVLIRYGGKKVLSAIIAFSILLIFIYIFAAVAEALFHNVTLTLILTAILSLAATALLYKYPEWYVIDVLGILICAGAASIFGISLEIFPVIILLIILALYDAISVYKTKHMIALAEGVINSKAPILVVIPKTRDYSYIRQGVNLEKDKKERGAFLMGMGDLIMPTILVVSSSVYLSAGNIIFGVSLPTLGAAAGTFAGLAVLLWFVAKGNPQAGLPTLNGGAILGFLLGCAASATWYWIPVL